MRRMVAIAVAGTLAITALFFFFLLRPKLQEIDEVRTQIAEAQANEQRLRNQIAQLEQARRNAPQTMAELERLQELLPPEPDLPAFIRLMQQVSERAGVTLRSIAPGLPSALGGANNVEVIQVSVTFRASFRRVQDYLARLETMRRVVEIQSLSLSPQPDSETGQTVLDASLSMRMFVVGAGATAGGGESA